MNKEAIMNTKMKAAQISKPGGDWELVEREIPEPNAGQVRVEVEACGICHSDALVKEGLWPGLQFPRVPGHEVAGHIDAIGDKRHSVDGWSTHWCRLAWWALFRVRTVPPRRLRTLLSLGTPRTRQLSRAPLCRAKSSQSSVPSYALPKPTLPRA